MKPCGPSRAFVAFSKASFESRIPRMLSPGSDDCLMLDSNLFRTSENGFGMNRVIRVMVYWSSCRVAIVRLIEFLDNCLKFA